jgi:hypothetical protein
MRSPICEIDIDPPRHPRPVEQDGFLRQPGEVRARSRLQGDIELRGGALGPIDFFRGRRRHHKPRSGAGRDLDVETIAAGDAARGVDENRREPLRLGRREAHAQRAGFVQMAAAGDALDLVDVEPHRAPGPIGRENH